MPVMAHGETCRTVVVHAGIALINTVAV